MEIMSHTESSSSSSLTPQPALFFPSGKMISSLGAFRGDIMIVDQVHSVIREHLQ